MSIVWYQFCPLFKSKGNRSEEWFFFFVNFLKDDCPLLGQLHWTDIIVWSPLKRIYLTVLCVICLNVGNFAFRYVHIVCVFSEWVCRSFKMGGCYGLTVVSRIAPRVAPITNVGWAFVPTLVPIVITSTLAALSLRSGEVPLGEPL